MSQLSPFIIVLVIALVINLIPMDGTIKHVINIVIGIAVLIMVLQYFKIL